MTIEDVKGVIRELEITIQQGVNELERECLEFEKNGSSWISKLEIFLRKMVNESKKLRPVEVASAQELNSIPPNLREIFRQTQICYDIFYELSQLYHQVEPKLLGLSRRSSDFYLKKVEKLRFEQDLVFRAKEYIKDLEKNYLKECNMRDLIDNGMESDRNTRLVKTQQFYRASSQDGRKRTPLNINQTIQSPEYSFRPGNELTKYTLREARTIIEDTSSRLSKREKTVLNQLIARVENSEIATNNLQSEVEQLRNDLRTRVSQTNRKIKDLESIAKYKQEKESYSAQNSQHIQVSNSPKKDQNQQNEVLLEFENLALKDRVKHLELIIQALEDQMKGELVKIRKEVLGVEVDNLIKLSKDIK